MAIFEAKNVYSYSVDDKVILYSPIARRYLLINDEQMNRYMQSGEYEELFAKLQQYTPLSKQRKVKHPEDYTLLTVLPNNICNFTCSYCYSAAGRNNSKIEQDKLHTAVDFFIDSKPDGFSRLLTISFMGGGEPFLSWDIVSTCIEYAISKALERNFRLILRIITNGSILNEAMLDFLSQHNVWISVSFEILPDIQNSQRKNYDIVRRNINKLIEKGIPVQLNSTITPANVAMLTQMMETLNRDYPVVKNVMFEPVVSRDIFPTPMDMRKFYKKYLEQFVKSLYLADDMGIELTSFAYLRTIYPLERACPGELCITADGFFSGCYCVATDKEELFDKTYYGKILGGKIVFERDRFDRLVSENVYSKAECADCRVKWNCGGGCFHQYNSYNKAYQDEICLFTKQFIGALIEYKVKKYYYKKFRVRLENALYFPEPIIFNEE